MSGSSGIRFDLGDAALELFRLSRSLASFFISGFPDPPASVTGFPDSPVSVSGFPAASGAPNASFRMVVSAGTG
jgi:hypothetical protein